MYILNHFAVHQKLTQHCEALILQFKKILKIEKKKCEKKTD